ncbi:MAG TPA: efflux transporter outer membrane subunit [Bryobacteraceae bacterium]|nr:efflux transporter outer membrane subunit [Bryobacteraceae bacterium]
MNIMKSVQCVCLGAVVFLTGCSMSPKYSRPKTPVPPVWRAEAAGQESQATAGAPAVSELKWQEFFTNEKLREVIALALAGSRDLRMAALNVERVQALYRIQSAQQFPTVNVSRSGDIYRLPEKMSLTGHSQTVEQYGLSVGAASWELDLFGRVRSLKSQALEQYLATEQARSATQIALVAAVAHTYLALAADRDNLRLAQATFNSQQASYELIKRTRDVGTASDLDVRQAESQMEAARVDIARYSGQLAQDENALNLLVGSPVSAGLLPSELGSDRALKDVSAGLSSEVLLRRPDILMAEHQLRAAYANIGAARAAFFPRIALTAGAGLMSGDLSDLYKSGARTWNFAPQALLPIFDAGTRKAKLKVAQVDRDSAIAEYEKAIQSAFREVSDSLSLRTRLMEQEDAQQALVNTLEETYRLADARYKAGIDGYLSVLIAQRSLYGAQQALVSLRLARLGNLVTLYKVLGGGA